MGWHKGSWWPLYVPDWYSPYVSQYPFDPYSFTHILHGHIFFHLFHQLGCKPWIGLLMGSFLEIVWETIENRPAWIEDFRENSGTSHDYKGDSYQNSLGDLVSCIAGYFLAWLFQVKGAPWLSLIWFLISELCCLVYMRDCGILIVLILMAPPALVPKDKIMQWQEQGVGIARIKDAQYGI